MNLVKPSVRAKTMAGCTRSLLLLSLIVLFRHSLQSEDDDDLVFLAQPPTSIYQYTGRIAIFNCTAVRRDPQGNETIISVQLYRNSEPIDSKYPPERHHALADGDNHVIGIAVGPTKEEDSGSRYHCEIHRGNERVESSIQSILYVGDGSPFPVTGLSQLSQTLYSITVGWDRAAAPYDAPIDSYILSLTELSTGEQFTVDADGNDTKAELFHLLPGEEYRVTVEGRNRHGAGQTSQELTAVTVKPVVPEGPPSVSVDVEITNTSSSVTVSWELAVIDPVSMTPIQYYAVYLRSRTNLINVNTTDNKTTWLTISDIIVGGNYSVEVAAVNSAGQGAVTLYNGRVALCGHLSVADNTIVMVTSIGNTIVAEYSCREGYLLVGSGTRECRPNGGWEEEEPFCVLLPDFQKSSQSGLSSAVVAGAAGGGAAIIIVVVVILVVVLLVCCWRRRQRRKTVKIHLTYGVPGSDSPSSVKKAPIEARLDPEVSMSITESTVDKYLNTDNGGPVVRNGDTLNGGSTFGKE